ncbi:unnamed protein product, partial [Rotaria sordida]
AYISLPLFIWCYTHRSYSSNALCYYKLSSSNHINEESRYEYSCYFVHFDRKNSVKYIFDLHSDQILVCYKTLVNLWNYLNRQFIKSFSWHIHIKKFNKP